ncbi:class I SAM-dependent methyltransferase [uncultured Prevotella sp.]|uniref:O-methyltransferase n=1 Tax=uncultured Prevotella sp. TaxID=159272 RepID=UPI00261CE339|nr:class I SAM-dependent methyltransferase [uncultured Prevotella sp.]
MTEELEKYVLSHSAPEGDYLYRLYRATNIHTIHGRMASGHLQGRLLKMFVEMIRPKNILEVGTFSGYSAICMAEGLAEIAKSTEAHANGGSVASAAEGNGKEAGVSKVWTFEINDEMEDFTRPWLEGSPVAEHIEFRIGDANVEAPKLGIEFDMAFVDGDKRTYVETYEMVLKLMRPGGFILADNTLWDGHVTDPAYDHDQQTQGIRRFNDHVAQDDRVEQVMIPLRDGLTVIRKK